MAKREIPETDPNALRDRYPSNSNSKKSNELAQKSSADISNETNIRKTRQVAQGRVRKQGLFKRFARYIISDTIESARERTLADTVVPGLKTLIFDTGTEILDLMLFGSSGDSFRSSKRRPESRREPRTSYSRYYDDRGRKSDSRVSYRELPNDPDDIIMDTRQKAKNALEELDYTIRKYGSASIADFYDIVGVTSEFTDNQYGWTSLREAGIRPVRDGFLIVLPRTKLLDD